MESWPTLVCIMQSQVNMAGSTCHPPAQLSRISTQYCPQSASRRSCSSRFASSRSPVRGSHNGHHSVQLSEPTPLTLQHSPVSEVQQLRENVQQLMSTVREQQIALAQQQATIQQLQGTLDNLQVNSGASNSSSSTTPPQPLEQQQSGIKSFVWDSSIRPFEVQKVALWDRRARGLYDARYHSTSM